jgi:hypothetical protein
MAEKSSYLRGKIMPKYLVQDITIYLVGHSETLAEAVRLAQEIDRGYGENPLMNPITLMLEGGGFAQLPIDLYAVKTTPTREEALEFISHRIADYEEVKEKAGEKQAEIMKFIGMMRCNYDDPVEKQIEDYIAKAPYRWKTPEEINEDDVAKWLEEALKTQ